MVLYAKGIHYSYPKGAELFHGYNFNMKSGECVGLQGASGSGKSTLARILAGYLRPTSGNVWMDQRPHSSKGCHPVQLVFQHPEKAVNPRWRIKAVLGEGGEVNPALMEALGIRQEWMNRHPSELSGGELQRVCVARALSVNPRFLICDEMTTMLDALTQAQIWRVVSKYVAKQGMGLLCITHSRVLAERMCERIVDLGASDRT